MARVVTNTILLLYLFSVHGLQSQFPLVAIISTLLIIVGTVYFLLIWKSSLLRKVKANPLQEELRERIETQVSRGQVEESNDSAQ